MFSFSVSPLSFCEDKVYVFSDTYSLKSCLRALQKSCVVPAGVYLIREQFFASLIEPAENGSISVSSRYLAFWQAVMPEQEYALAIDKAMRFFAFWQEINSLDVDFAALKKILVANQEDFWEKMSLQREQYLAKLQEWEWQDFDVEGYAYSPENSYAQPVVFCDCFSFTPKQKKWLKANKSVVELQFSTPEELYDSHDFALREFDLADLQWLSFPQIQIKQYEQKIFMDASLVNDGHKTAYGKKTKPIFDLFGSDVLGQDRQSYQILQALHELLQDRRKSDKIALDKLLRFVSLKSWQDDDKQEAVISKKMVLNLLDKRYKYFTSKPAQETLRKSFLQFLDDLSDDLHCLLDYLKALDSNCVYLEKVAEAQEAAEAFGLQSLQVLQFLLSELARAVVAVDQNKLKIQSVCAVQQTKKLVVYNATEPFWSFSAQRSDFFSASQRQTLCLPTEEQLAKQARLSFFKALALCGTAEIYTYENVQENVQRASLVDELLASPLDVNLKKYADLSLAKLFAHLLQGDKTYVAGEEKEFVFPYKGQPLDDFSYSQAARFLEDAQSYYLSVILRIREFLPPSREIENSLIGEIAHKIFQDWLEQGESQDLQAVAQKVLLDYEDKLPENFHKVYFEKYVLAKISESARFFASKCAEKKGECEKSLQKYFADYGINLRGRADYLGEKTLCDFKTGKRNSAKMAQLEFYSLLGENLEAYFYLIFDKFFIDYVPPKDGLAFLPKLQERIKQVKKDGFRAEYDEAKES